MCRVKDLDLKSTQRWTILLSCRSDTLNNHELWEKEYLGRKDEFFKVVPRGEAEKRQREKVGSSLCLDLFLLICSRLPSFGVCAAMCSLRSPGRRAAG